MRIREIRGARPATAPRPRAAGATSCRPDDCVHTLVAVLTDEGPVGCGSVVHQRRRWCAPRSRVLEPLYRGENALEPERVSEKLHQNTFWLGRGGAITHTISGIDIALWDMLGKATGQPVGRLLGGRYRERVRPYASILMRRAGAAARAPAGADRAQGFRAFKIGWGPFGRRERRAWTRRSCARAREAVGPDVAADGRCRRQRRVLAARLQVGAADGGDARGLRRRLVRGAAAARRARRLRAAARARPGADRRRRGADPAAVVPAVAAGPAPSTSSSRT